MKEKNKSNSGFTLIELIIAIAVLAFLMTAVSSLMGSSILSFRKSKAEIQVHTTAQETYNKLTDAIIQSNNIIICGYICDTELTKNDFIVPEQVVSVTPTLYYFVRDDEMKNALIANPAKYGAGAMSQKPNTGNVKLFTEINNIKSTDTSVVVKYMRIETAVPIDMANCNTMVSPDATTRILENKLTGENVNIGFIKKTPIKDSKGTVVGSNYVYDTYDTLVNTFTFEKENMYYEKEYAFMTTLNDKRANSNLAPGIDYIYNKSFSHIVSSTGIEMTGCIATIDAEDGAIGLELCFNDKNMDYTTLGMVNTRNSRVLTSK